MRGQVPTQDQPNAHNGHITMVMAAGNTSRKERISGLAVATRLNGRSCQTSRKERIHETVLLTLPPFVLILLYGLFSKGYLQPASLSRLAARSTGLSVRHPQRKKISTRDRSDLIAARDCDDCRGAIAGHPRAANMECAWYFAAGVLANSSSARCDAIAPVTVHAVLTFFVSRHSRAATKNLQLHFFFFVQILILI